MEAIREEMDRAAAAESERPDSDLKSHEQEGGGDTAVEVASAEVPLPANTDHIGEAAAEAEESEVGEADPVVPVEPVDVD